MKYLLQICLMLCSHAAVIAQSSGELEIIIQNGHSNTITCIDLSPDGQWAISGSVDHTIKLWHVATGKDIKTLYGHKGKIQSVAFSPNGKYFLSADNNGGLKLWDASTGQELKEFKNNYSSISSASFSNNTEYVYALGNGLLGKWETLSGNLVKEITLKASCFVLSPDEKKVLSDGINNTVVLSELEDGKAIKTFSGHTKKVKCVTFGPDGKLGVSGSDDGTVKVWDLQSGSLKKSLIEAKPEAVIDDWIFPLNSVKVSPDGQWILAGATGVNVWDINTGKKTKQLSGNSAIFSKNGSLVLTANFESKKIDLWDFSRKEKIRTFSSNEFFIKDLKMGHQSNSIYFSNTDLTIKTWNVNSASLSKKFLYEGYDFKNFDFSQDEKLAAAILYNGEIKVWDFNNSKSYFLFDQPYGRGSHTSVTITPTGKIWAGNEYGEVMQWDYVARNTIKRFTDKKDMIGARIDAVKITADEKIALAVKNNHVTRTNIITSYNIEKGKPLKKFIGHTSSINDVAFAHDFKSFYTTSSDGALKHWDLLTGKEIKSFQIEGLKALMALALSPNGKNIAISGNDHVLRLLDTSTGKVLKSFEGHQNDIVSIAFSQDGSRLITGSRDGTIRIWDLESGDWTAFIANKDATKWIIFTHDGFWDASPNGGDLVAMVQGLKVYNIDQFAIRSNRPDIILKRIGSTNQELIDHYFKQYQKRLKKLNLTENQLSTNLHIPKAEIKLAKQEGKYANIQFELTDSEFDLKWYNIFVNDVPLFGAYGKPISGKFQLINERVELTTGENKIEISCQNEKGVESYRALTEINYLPELKGDLYVLSFGVSKYQDASLNLQFADKDAKDLAETFTRFEGKSFNRVFTKIYLNDQVTTENIKGAREFIKNAKPDDAFILFIAGHGMYDKTDEATYYYLTHNADPNNLVNTAANFELIEGILQGIAPRRKLFFMDTCESGEKDESTESNSLAVAETSGLKTRGIKIVKSNQGSTGERRIYLNQKDRYIYNDLVRRSGAIVFSSSQGSEYSYESEAIQNGFFTREIIESLSNKAADLDKNGNVSIDEMKTYVSKSVSEKTKGLQNPTVDRDNIFLKFDFVQIKN